MNYYLITVAYDGSNFSGWAKQPRQFTVQGYIEEILTKIFQRKISISATSRTDKGVHALDQKFTFSLPFFLTEERMMKILKKNIYEHVLVKKVEKISSNFHPLKKKVIKEYRYFINTGKYNLFSRKYRWEYCSFLEKNRLNKILKVFVGEQNFFNFSYCRWKDRENTNTKREIISLKSWKEKNILVISAIAKGFLRYQIRAIVGESINCYEGKQTIENLREKLINFDKKNYKYKNIAPSSGLYLWKIKYLL